MALLVLAVLGGLVAGLARRPAGIHTVRPQVDHIWLLAVGAGLNALSIFLEGTASVVVLAASLAVLITVAFANRHITGVAVVGVGLLLNLVGVAVNGGMPVRVSAMEAAGLVEPGAPVEVSDPRHLETSDDPVPVLGDVLPVPFANEVVSFGDLIIVVGAADAVRELSRRRARVAAHRQVGAQGGLHIRSTRLDQVCGTAPSGAPVLATQYSEYPDRSTPVTIDLASAELVTSEPELVAASHSR